MLQVVLVLWFRTKLTLGAEEAHLSKECLRSFFISRKFGVRETAPLGCGRSPNDQLFYDLVEDRFQVGVCLIKYVFIFN